MKRPSPEAIHAISALERRDSFLESLFASKRREDAVHAIARLGEPSAIPFLMPHLFQRDKKLSSLVAETIGRLFPSVGDDIADLDESIRRRFDYGIPYWEAVSSGYSRHWNKLHPNDLKKLKGMPFELRLYGLMASHNSGFVRQEALRYLQEFRTGEELPFLFMRLNDWVPQVAEEAKSVLRSRLTPAYAPFFGRYLEQVDRLLAWKRIDHRPFVDAVYALLRESEGGRVVVEGLSSPKLSVKRLCYQLAWGLPLLHFEGLLLKAISEPDAAIHRWAAERARKDLPDEASSRILPNFERSKSVVLRREALMAWIERFPERADAKLREALFDENGSIRAIAQFNLEKRGGGPGFVAVYSARLAAGGTLPQSRVVGAIAGLGETGKGEHAEFIRSYAKDRRPAVRRAALRALARLDAVSHPRLFLAALLDRSRLVVRAASEILAAHSGLATPQELWAVLLEAASEYSKFRVLKIIDRFPKWAALDLLLRASLLPDPIIVSKTEDRVDVWLEHFNRDFSRLSSQDCDRLLRLVDECGIRQKKDLERILRDQETG